MADASGPRPFLVVFSGSTGSTWLIGQLRKRTDVLIEGEALARRPAAEEQRDFVDRFFTQDGPAARGFKAKMFQIADPPALRTALDGYGVRYVHLERANRVKQAISLITSHALGDRAVELTGTRRANLRKADLDRHPELAIGPIAVDVAQLRHTIAEIEARERELASFVHDADVVRLTYESLLADQGEFYDKFCRAVGIPSRPVVDSDVVKKTDDDLRTAIANFDDCLAALRGTPYEAQLIDGAADR